MEPEKWLEETDRLQKEAFGRDWAALQGSERADAVRTNVLAALDELHEALAECSWKPWSKDEPGTINREKFITELVDANHFIANLLTIVECSDEEYWRIYSEKMGRNRARQDSGYSASRNRCPGCKRELDARGAYRWESQEARHKDDGTMYMRHKIECKQCRESITIDLELGEYLPGKGPHS